MRGRFAATLLCATVLVGGLLPTAAAAVEAASDPAAGFQAQWVVNRPDGSPRNDDSIAVGDDLAVSWSAVDGTPVASCQIRMQAVGGEMMQTPGNVADGSCSMTVRMPDFPEPAARSRFDSDAPALDLCVWPLLMTFTDAAPRTLRDADHLQPAGRLCTTGVNDDTGLLDFKVEPGGTPRPFASDPRMLSWNPLDWGTDMQPLRFGTTWHYRLPDWATSCWPMLRGTWQMGLRAEHLPGCDPWDLRIPGILPATLPWTGDPGEWDYYIDSLYRVDPALVDSLTITAARMPYAASDQVFESNHRAIFPVDLATTRFVTAGDGWRPVFQVSGGSGDECRMEMYTVPPTWPADDIVTDRYTAPLDTDGRCAFDVPALAENEHHQYYVMLAAEGLTPTDITYGGSIEGIPAPTPPEIDPPTEESGGDTGIGVDPGAGNGLVVDLEVSPATIGSTARTSLSADPSCQDRAISTNLETGGAIPHLDARCTLAPGSYVATATMVDAVGSVTTSTRTFTVLAPPPSVAARTPSSGATGEARDVRPTITFDMAVTGVSGSTVRLRDVLSGVWIPVTVTYDAVRHRATLRPGALLGAGRTYRVSVTAGIRNAANRVLVATGWQFRVTTDARRPTFTRSPGASRTGISRTANVTLQFSEAVRGASGTTIRLKDSASGAWVAAAVTYDAVHHRAVLNPSTILRGSRTYIVVVRSGITDRAGNPLAATSWSFTTRR